jgi:alpha-tubulin suppressor-like RCC1 family protein
MLEVSMSRQRSGLVAAIVAVLLCLTAPPAIAVDGAGQISTWGDNTYGQLGDGSTTDHLTPKLIPSLSGVQQLEGGREHVLALTTTGAVLAWGWNKHGQVGNGSTGGIVKSPAQVLTAAIDIGAGHYSSFAVKADGTVWGWGQNTSGQIGTGTTALRVRAPRRIAGLDGVSIVDVAGGRNHAIALTAGGTVYAWGSNQYGQLGNGTWQNSSDPVLVSSLTDVVGIFAGRDHNLAVRSDGSVWSWGYNGHGELGDGTSTNRNAPVRVVRLNGSALGKIVQVGAGANHSLALRSDGTLWAWGRNNFGQLGEGTFSTRRRAVQVSGLSSVEQMAGGRQNSIAVTTGGQVYTWGENLFGQLGDGTVSTTGRNIPGKVASLSNVSAVGMGRDYGMAIVVP